MHGRRFRQRHSPVDSLYFVLNVNGTYRPRKSIMKVAFQTLGCRLMPSLEGNGSWLKERGRPTISPHFIPHTLLKILLARNVSGNTTLAQRLGFDRFGCAGDE